MFLVLRDDVIVKEAETRSEAQDFIDLEVEEGEDVDSFTIIEDYNLGEDFDLESEDYEDEDSYDDRMNREDEEAA